MLVVQLVRADGSGFWFLVSGFWCLVSGFGLFDCSCKISKEREPKRKKEE